MFPHVQVDAHHLRRYFRHILFEQPVDKPVYLVGVVACPDKEVFHDVLHTLFSAYRFPRQFGATDQQEYCFCRRFDGRNGNVIVQFPVLPGTCPDKRKDIGDVTLHVRFSVLQFNVRTYILDVFLHKPDGYNGYSAVPVFASSRSPASCSADICPNCSNSTDLASASRLAFATFLAMLVASSIPLILI